MANGNNSVVFILALFRKFEKANCLIVELHEKVFIASDVTNFV